MNNDKNGKKRQKLRLIDFCKTVDELKDEADNMLIIGGLNIDQWMDNELESDQKSRPCNQSWTKF